MAQSIVDLEDPTRLHFDYMQRIAALIDARPAGRLRVLHVGGAAMSLARYVALRRPTSAQIVLEPAVEVIEQVRREAPLPPRSGVKIRPVDGMSGIAQVRDASQDVVILDAFKGAQVPAELLGAQFIAHVRRVLDADGVVVANISDRAPFTQVRSFVAGLREADRFADVAVGAEPATLKGRRGGNLLVAAGTWLGAPFGEHAPMEYRTYGGQAVRDSFGGGTVLA